MSNYRILFKRVVISDGRAIAEAQSQVLTAAVSDNTVTQSVTVQATASDNWSRASSCSSSG